MTTDDRKRDLIEQAAKAIHDNYSETPWDDADYTDRVWAEGTARKILSVFEEARKPHRPPTTEFVLIEGGKETDWVDPVIEFDELTDGYRVWNGYASYWFAKGPDITYVIRTKEHGDGS